MGNKLYVEIFSDWGYSLPTLRGLLPYSRIGGVNPADVNAFLMYSELRSRLVKK